MMKTGEMNVQGASQETGKSLVQTVYVWPDTTRRYADEYNELEDSWKGDDYAVLTFPSTATEDEIEDCVVKYFGGV